MSGIACKTINYSSFSFFLRSEYGMLSLSLGIVSGASLN